MYISSIFLLLISYSTIAQNFSPDVISSAGETFQNNEVQLDWTLGEVMTATLENNTNILSQGFQQPYLEITSINKLSSAFGNIKIFPNPTHDWINFDLTLNQNTTVLIRLFDTNGKLIWENKKQETLITDKLNLKYFSSGNYILNFSCDKEQFSQSFQILKIN